LRRFDFDVLGAVGRRNKVAIRELNLGWPPIDAEADKALSEIEAGTSDGKLLKSAFNRLCIATRNFSRGSLLRSERMGSYLGDATEAPARLQINRASLMLAVVRKLTATEKQL